MLDTPRLIREKYDAEHSFMSYSVNAIKNFLCVHTFVVNFRSENSHKRRRQSAEFALIYVTSR
jgi:hypothetical protein